MPKITRAIAHEVVFKIYSKVNQVIYSSLVYSPSFKIASIFFQRAITQERDLILPRIKYMFFHEESKKKIQNSSMHVSKVMLCIKKRDERRDRRTYEMDVIRLSL